MTVDEYLRTPISLKPNELIFGRFRAAESPAARHQSAVASLFIALHPHVRERKLGTLWLSPLDCILDYKRAIVMQPDLLFISKSRSWIVTDRVHGAPDLVIEVLSPKPRIGDTEERVQLFGEFGVRECWLVHQDRQEIIVLAFAKRQIREQRIFGAKDAIRSDVLPDFTATWDSLFGHEM